MVDRKDSTSNWSDWTSTCTSKWMIWVVAIATGVGAMAFATFSIVGAITGRWPSGDWEHWMIPAWLFPTLAALGVFGKSNSKTKCGGLAGKDADAEPNPRGRSSARAERQRKRDARRQAREDKRAARRNRRNRRDG